MMVQIILFTLWALWVGYALGEPRGYARGFAAASRDADRPGSEGTCPNVTTR